MTPLEKATNSHNNIDVRRQLNRWLCHIRHVNAIQACHNLEIPYRRALTGFNKRTPVLAGAVFAKAKLSLVEAEMQAIEMRSNAKHAARRRVLEQRVALAETHELVQGKGLGALCRRMGISYVTNTKPRGVFVSYDDKLLLDDHFSSVASKK